MTAKRTVSLVRAVLQKKTLGEQEYILLNPSSFQLIFSRAQGGLKRPKNQQPSKIAQIKKITSAV